MNRTKKSYHAPRIVQIGDMTKNTLGSTGSGTDAGTYKGGGNTSNRSGSGSSGRQRGPFDKSTFDKSIFNR